MFAFCPHCTHTWSIESFTEQYLKEGICVPGMNNYREDGILRLKAKAIEYQKSDADEPIQSYIVQAGYNMHLHTRTSCFGKGKPQQNTASTTNTTVNTQNGPSANLSDGTQNDTSANFSDHWPTVCTQLEYSPKLGLRYAITGQNKSRLVLPCEVEYKPFAVLCPCGPYTYATEISATCPTTIGLWRSSHLSCYY